MGAPVAIQYYISRAITHALQIRVWPPKAYVISILGMSAPLVNIGALGVLMTLI